MRIDATEFGAVTIDAKTYEHDVVIRLSGKVEKRRKRLSKEKYGTSHIVSKEEARFVFEDGCEVFDRRGRPGRKRPIISGSEHVF